ncbi:MAG: hypothetical protein KKF44_10390 [Nanoarchaeota archaeon]|nr:hypothetical protein [Nanoarchaeota archaeon]
MNCKICSTSFDIDSDILYLCKHHGSFVHPGCCINDCSQDNAPCRHRVASFMNLDKK